VSKFVESIKAGGHDPIRLERRISDGGNNDGRSRVVGLWGVGSWFAGMSAEARGSVADQKCNFLFHDVLE
jgi:hypothetical protein